MYDGCWPSFVPVVIHVEAEEEGLPQLVELATRAKVGRAAARKHRFLRRVELVEANLAALFRCDLVFLFFTLRRFYCLRDLRWVEALERARDTHEENELE